PHIGQYSKMLLRGMLILVLFGIGAGMTVWFCNVMPQYEVHSPYDELPSEEEEKGSFSEFFMKSADESGFTKRPLMRRTLIAAMLPLGIAPVVLLRDLGPLPGNVLKETPWRNGRRMFVEGTDRELRVEDMENDPNGMISALPALVDEDYEHGISMDDQAKSVDRKSTRLNSSHVSISYAVFCLKKKKHNKSTELYVDKKMQATRLVKHALQSLRALILYVTRQAYTKTLVHKSKATPDARITGRS